MSGASKNPYISARVEYRRPPDLGRLGLSAPMARSVLGHRAPTIEALMDSIGLYDLTLGYDGHPAVHHLSGVFEAGSMTAVVGPNGSGKSTLLKGITGILHPLGGRIERGSLKTSQLAYLPQQAEIDRSFPITVLDTVAFGLWHHIGMFGGIKKEQWRQARQALAAVGLDGFEDRPIGNLSAGQFQRVLFARLLLQDCPVILLDEPFTAIDARTTADLLDVIQRWHTENRMIIVVLHDLDQVRASFPKTLMIAREPIGWGDTLEILTSENLQRARRMSEAWDEAAKVCRISAL
jgi:zinc/manganese transport system ATP-binding protein